MDTFLKIIQTPSVLLSDCRLTDKAKAVLLLVIASVVLSGCQTLTRYQCNSKDWRAVGVKDGAAGKAPGSTFEAYDSNCSSSGASIDRNVYMAGHKEGLSRFCTFSNGAKQAAEGLQNSGLCTAEYGEEFNNGFARGLLQICNASGGRRFGSEVITYRGTCSTQTQPEFLNSYITTLESVALPEIRTRLSTLSVRASSLQRSLTFLATEISGYDTKIKAAKADGNDKYAEILEEGKADLSDEQTSIQQQKNSIDSEIKELEKKRKNATDMIVRWKPEITG